MSDGRTDLRWRRSRRCGDDACVEVAFAADAVHLRASGGPAGTSLALSRPAWSDLVARLKAGELDRPA